jgi:hypothetical protein
MSIFDVEARMMAEEAAERERVNEEKAALNNVLAHKTLDELRDYLYSQQRTDIGVSVHENRVTASAGQAQLVITCEKSVNRLPTLTPPGLGHSKAYGADRRWDPTPNNTNDVRSSHRAG